MDSQRTEDKAKALKLFEDICKLEKEQERLALQSYSQSDPGAVMDRRFVKRDLERKQRQYTEIVAKYSDEKK